MSPLLSIIIPTFDRRDFLHAAIDSALHQTYPNVEVIVVDDGSTDGTEKLLKQLATVHSPERFRYVQQENQGPSSARNHGLRVARGNFIKFLDSDDTIDLDAADAYISSLEKTGADLCIGARRYMSPEGKKWQVNYFADESVLDRPLRALFEVRLKPQGALWCYRRSAFDSTTWDETLLAREDTDLLTRLLVQGARVCSAPAAIYNQRYHSAGRQIEKQFKPEVLESIIRSYSAQLDLMRERNIEKDDLRAFAQSMSRTALRLWTIDRRAARRVYQIARRAVAFPELVVVDSYPISKPARIAAYFLWAVGGVRLCGPIWMAYVKIRRGMST